MRDVLVPAHDLLPGVTIESGDLRVVSVPAALAPDGVLTDPADATGRTPAVILADGLPLTASLVEGGSVAALAPEGTVVVPVQLDAATAALLRPGDHVDVVIGVGNATVGDTPQFLARRALVLPVGVRDQDADSGGLFGGAQPSQATITLLAVDPREAPALSAASGSRTLAAVLVP
jgi:Flp pilus assembly protein CpaB